MYYVAINGIELNPNMVWEEEHRSGGVVQRVRYTLGGVPAVGVATRSSREITLKATQDSGWLTTTMVEALKSMANTPGAVVQVTIDDVLVNVPAVFRHHDAPALEFVPLTPRSTPLPTDYWVGVIKLMTV